MVFELITGDYLFDPKSGDKYAKEEDHIAYIIELIGHPDLKWLEQGKRFRKWFTTRGRMKRIYKHKIWRLEDIFKDKYSFKTEEAEQLADFLMQALQWKNEDRKSAQEMLEHPWLSMPADYNYREESDGEGEGSDNEDDDDDDEEETPAKDKNKDDDDKSWVTVSSDDESDEASNSSEFELVDHP